MSGFARRLQQAGGVNQPVIGATLAQDNFNRSDGSLGTADMGGVWTTFGVPTWGITGNAVALSATNGTNSSAVATLPVNCTTGTAFADMYLSAGGANTGLALLASSDGSTYLNIQLNENPSSYDRVAISKRVSGTTTWLAEDDTANFGNGVGYSVAVVLTANDVTLYVDGINRLSYTFLAQDKTDLSVGAHVGLRSWFGPQDEDGGSFWDRFLVTDAVSAPAPRVPAAPWVVTAMSAGSGQADITWQRGGNGGCALTGYVLTSSAGPSFNITDATATSFTATGLSNVAQTFTLKAVNVMGQSAGAVSGSVTPSAASVPDAPTNVVASVADSQAPVSWTAPANDGGSPITGYTVTSNPGNKTATTSGATSTIVTGLTNGTSYTFTVQATNPNGTSVASAPSNSVTPAVASGFNYLLSPSTYGYPDATNTGSADKNSLTLHVGSITLTDGQTLSDTYVQGTVTISGSGTTPPTITNCYIENSGASRALTVSWSGSGNPTITDTTLVSTSQGCPTCVSPGTGIFTRVNASGGNDVIDGGHSQWFDSFMHGCVRNAAGNSHDDVYQPLSGSFLARHCTAYPTNGTDKGNSVMQIGIQFGAITTIEWDDCLFDGGNYTFNANWGATSPNTTTGTHPGPYTFGSALIHNSRFGRHYNFGPKGNANPPSGTFTWTNNVYDDDGTPA